MTATPTLYALGTCPLAATMAAGTTTPSWFEARATGAKTLTLSGSAEFGAVAEPDGAGRFVLTLGAASPTGAVLFTRLAVTRPEPGIYQLDADAPGAIKALVVTGIARRSHRGTLRDRCGGLRGKRCGERGPAPAGARGLHRHTQLHLRSGGCGRSPLPAMRRRASAFREWRPSRSRTRSR